MVKIDAFDRKLIAGLDYGERLSTSELARTIKLGRDLVEYRYKRLVDLQVILGIKAIINPAALGLYYFKTYFKLQKQDSVISDFCAALKENKHVSCFAETVGEWDLIANVMAPTAQQFAKILDDLCAPLEGSFLKLNFAGIRRYRAFNRKYFAPKLFKDRQVFETCQERPVEAVDELDLKIIALLSSSANRSILEIADRCKSHPHTIRKRIQELEQRKIIIGYRAAIDRKKLGIEMYKIIVEQNTYNQVLIDNLLQSVKKEPTVTACIEHLGPYHLELNLEEPSLADCEETASRLLEQNREVLLRQSIVRIKQETFNPFLLTDGIKVSKKQLGLDGV